MRCWAGLTTPRSSSGWRAGWRVCRYGADGDIVQSCWTLLLHCIHAQFAGPCVRGRCFVQPMRCLPSSSVGVRCNVGSHLKPCCRPNGYSYHISAPTSLHGMQLCMVGNGLLTTYVLIPGVMPLAETGRWSETCFRDWKQKMSGPKRFTPTCRRYVRQYISSLVIAIHAPTLQVALLQLGAIAAARAKMSAVLRLVSLRLPPRQVNKL
jgi:hypothetical protein